MKLLRSHYFGGRAACCIGAVGCCAVSPDARGAEDRREAGGSCRPSWPIAKIATGVRRKAFTAIFRSAPRRPAARVSEKSAGSLHRAPANQQHHVQCRSFIEPSNDRRACRGFSRAQSATARRRSEAVGRQPAKKYSKTACPKPTLPPVPPATAQKPRVAARFRACRPAVRLPSTNWSIGARSEDSTRRA